MPSLARRAAPAWASPYRSASLRCTADGFGSSRNPAKAPHLRSPYRLLLSASGAGMSKRILAVEDQPDNRQIIRDMLAGTNYEITEAEDLPRSGPLALRAALTTQR